MTEYSTIRASVDGRGIATLALNRPEVRNAINPALIDEATAALRAFNGDARVRGIVLRGEGKLFSAGADLNWMRTARGQSRDVVLAESGRLLALFRLLDESPKATLCRVHGGAYAGALGFVACADIVIAESSARFAVSEVRLGMYPAIVASVLIPRMGVGWLRYMATTATVVDAATARAAGLVHEVATDAVDLDTRVEKQIGQMLAASPDAIAAFKRAVHGIAGGDREKWYADWLQQGVDTRASRSGQEGMAAFLEGRPPAWAPPKGT